MRHLDLFSGIGGFALATEMVWDNVEHVFCDNDLFSQAILKKHWPNAPIYGDIRQLTTNPDSERELQSQGTLEVFREWIGNGIDLVTGGFPCQPFSAAGRRRGTEDDRHLWPEMLRVIRETNPTYVLGENVGGLLTWDGGMVFEQVCTDLEEAGYEVGAFVIPAAAVGAPHRRDRVWIAAHAIGSNAIRAPRFILGEKESERVPERDEVGKSGEPGRARVHNAPDTRREYGKSRTSESTFGETSERSSATKEIKRYECIDWQRDWHEVAAELCRMDDGVPKRLDRSPRLKALGNAIVPQVAAEVMKALTSTSY